MNNKTNISQKYNIKLFAVFMILWGFIFILLLSTVPLSEMLSDVFTVISVALVVSFFFAGVLSFVIVFIVAVICSFIELFQKGY